MNTQTKTAIYRLLRVILGALFVFSGFVKCVDPTGGAIKIEDYFVAWGLDEVPFGFCLFLSVAQNIVEFMTGVMLLCGAFVSVSSLVALLFMVFFTPLTLYIALFDPVSDCGCFGDALKLTNWQTFNKNLVFLAMAVVVFLWRKLETANDSRRMLVMTGCGLVVSLLVTVKGLTDEPMADFRPYAVGTDIKVAMSIPEGAPLTEYKTLFLLEKDGEIRAFDENDYPYDDPTWEYRDTKTEVIKEGYLPSISDFTFTDLDGNEMTDILLNTTDPLFLVVSPKVEKATTDDLQKVAHQCELARKNGFEFYVATSSAESQFVATNERAGANFDYLLADETMLKTIARSNPALIVLQNGVIVAKYNFNHMPDDVAMKSPAAAYLASVSRSYSWMQVLCLAMLIAIVWLSQRRKQD